MKTKERKLYKRHVSVKGTTFDKLERRAAKLGRKVGGTGGIVDDLINRWLDEQVGAA